MAITLSLIWHFMVRARPTLAYAACLFLMAGLGAPAIAQKSPERITLTPQSSDGVIMLKVEQFTAPYLLMIQKAGQSGFGSRVYTLAVKQGNPGAIYIARTLKPGRYVIRSIWQQSVWGLQFSRSTVEFDIRPGRVSYLGNLNARELLDKLQSMAVAADKQTVKLGSGYVTSDHGLTPQFAGRDVPSIREAQQFSETVMKADASRFDVADLTVTSEAPNK